MFIFPFYGILVYYLEPLYKMIASVSLPFGSLSWTFARVSYTFASVS